MCRRREGSEVSDGKGDRRKRKAVLDDRPFVSSKPVQLDSLDERRTDSHKSSQGQTGG